MNLVNLVIALALLQFFIFCMAVGKARATYKIEAPATTGNEVFERYFRVQMNTLEMLIIFVPAILMFARYVNAYWAAGLGVVYLIGRTLYFRGYVKAPAKRSMGYLFSGGPTIILLVGAIIGVLIALSHGVS
jgi:glutathione S-transferase